MQLAEAVYLAQNPLVLQEGLPLPPLAPPQPHPRMRLREKRHGRYLKSASSTYRLFSLKQRTSWRENKWAHMLIVKA